MDRRIKLATDGSSPALAAGTSVPTAQDHCSRIPDPLVVFTNDAAAGYNVPTGIVHDQQDTTCPPLCHDCIVAIAGW